MANIHREISVITEFRLKQILKSKNKEIRIMSWNNAVETIKFKKEQTYLENFYKANGMSDMQISAIQAYDKREFLNRRSRCRKSEEIPMYEVDENGNEYSIVSEISCVDDVMTDPFIYGFEDERLNRIWHELDNEVDRIIFHLLSKGARQPQISSVLHISQQSISKRIAKFRVL